MPYFASLSSYLLPPIPCSLFLSSLFSLCSSIPRWLLPAGAVRACEALRTAVSLTYFCTAPGSAGEVNLQWHVQYVAQMFPPSPEVSHAIRSVPDKGYRLGIWGKWSNGWEVKQRLALTLASSSYTPACSDLGTGDGRGGDVWGRWLNPSPPEVDVLHLREGAEGDFSKWKLQVCPKPPLQLSFGHRPCLGSRKGNFVHPSSLLPCVGKSQPIYL